nr:hypothetical protein [Halomonas elongata]
MAGPQGGWINGQVLRANGGFSEGVIRASVPRAVTEALDVQRWVFCWSDELSDEAASGRSTKRTFLVGACA